MPLRQIDPTIASDLKPRQKKAAELLHSAPADLLGGVGLGILMSMATNVISTVATSPQCSLLYLIPSALLAISSVYCFLFFEKRRGAEDEYAKTERQTAVPAALKEAYVKILKSETLGEILVSHYNRILIYGASGIISLIGLKIYFGLIKTCV